MIKDFLGYLLLGLYIFFGAVLLVCALVSPIILLMWAFKQIFL